MAEGHAAPEEEISEQAAPKAKGSPRVLVSVLSYNSAQTTIEALRCLSRQTYPEYHLQLIDNGSTDETVQRAAREFPELDIKTLASNSGYTGGSNFALRQALEAGYDYVIICTHDVEVDERVVERLVETALAHADAGVVGGVEENIYSGELRAAGGGSYSRWFSRARWHGAAVTATVAQEVFCVQGALQLLTLKAVSSGLMMDENLFMYFDEVDLGFQLRERGLKAVVDGRVRVGHKRRTRLYTPAEGYLMQRNRLYMVRKYGRWYHRAFYLLYSSLVELPAKVLVRGLQGHIGFAGACVAGHVDGLLGRNGYGRLSAYEPGAYIRGSLAPSARTSR